MADPLDPCREGLAEDLRKFKEEVRGLAEAFFDTQERTFHAPYPNPFERVVRKSRPFSEFPEITYRHAGAWSGESFSDTDVGTKLPDPGAADDGFGVTPEEDQKLGRLWQDYLAASRKKVRD